MDQRGDLWLIVACIGVVLLLAFCVWGVHFTPDMSQPPNTAQQGFGALALCGGPILLLLAVFLFAAKI